MAGGRDRPAALRRRQPLQRRLEPRVAFGTDEHEEVLAATRAGDLPLDFLSRLRAG
jgi:hypothetical protein